MNNIQGNKKDHFYTKDYEWIEFQGSVAYTGICKFKLTGFRQIQEVHFEQPLGFKKQGEIIATVKYNDYVIEAHIPVDGKILQVNEQLISGNYNILMDCEDSSAWLALIAPLLPQERQGLLLPKQYQMIYHTKHVK